MQEPDIKSSRHTLAIAIALVLLLTASGFFIGRATAPGYVKAVVTAPSPDIVTDLTRLELSKVLGRPDMVRLQVEATEALVAGQGLPASMAKLAGRRFDVVLPFGCRGPAGHERALGWVYDPGRDALDLHVELTRWQPGLWDMPGEEVLEGFWLQRPWAVSDACPVNNSPTARAFGGDLVSAPETLAMAEVATQRRREGPRTYDTVVRMPEGRLAASSGFRLRLKGRIADFAPGVPVKCVQPAGIDQRPVCVVGVTLDEMRVENPLSGETLAVWALQTSPRQNS